MRVLHVLDHSLPMHSGYAFRTRAIMRAQLADGLDVRALTGLRHTADGPEDDVCEGLRFHRTAGTASGPPGLHEWREVRAQADAIERLARDWRPDVLHAHSPALCGLAAIRAGKRLGIPVVYEIRAFWEDAAVGNGTGTEGSPKYRLTRALENHVVAGADAVFTICEGLRQDLVERGFAPDKIGLSPNAVDMAQFGTPAPRDAALAAKLGVGDGPVIGFIGSFYPYEGLDDLIDALPLLRRRHPDTTLLLVGGGPEDAALRAQAAASPDRGRIVFTGRVPHDEVAKYYALVDILAFPRKRSRLTELVTPLKPLEAMAQGRIVAASDVGGHRELIDHEETGVLFPADDSQGLAHMLANMLDDTDSLPAMRERARRFVAASRDWQINSRLYLDVYHLLLPNRTDRSRESAAWMPQRVHARHSGRS
ncbi:TIGR04063 family PEP-CTERM/XrtA system glycosyltransferase [Alteriqipengyuania lutimaris]|uniref:Glycosyltransferase, exosortase A system-associated n=1 Tax=Alteriqipengyuania lutimaris TaxID=1538146 RepID=A0A395LJP0_9SPHN|nr:TIGR04063 family PEP-CTERM/XrtA system glycosyltransferase [Alteriqipengyuania lutimaris]MBB3034189.1 PEP-CTERM/exosortase A-associated glycosyltransferase [Alteriqipengyuania lutimaris]RDS76889.1 glycosyltransferase, exosortase A system-associated [Alteriqipengyuania lutimaris]